MRFIAVWCCALIVALLSSAALAAESGVTPSGLYFTIYSDGEATVSRSKGALETDWKIKCSIDKMNDKKECFVAAKRSPIVVDYGYSDKPRRVCVAGHDFPRRTAMIRAGKSKPIATESNGCVSVSRILPALLNSDSVATRKYHWPYSDSLDESGPLTGLKEALGIVAIIRGRI